MTVKDTAELIEPLFATAVVKVVVPHPPPLEVLGAVLPVNVQKGRVTTTLSPTASAWVAVNAIVKAVVEP